eukprot:gene7509-17104_t
MGAAGRELRQGSRRVGGTRDQDQGEGQRRYDPTQAGLPQFLLEWCPRWARVMSPVARWIADGSALADAVAHGQLH